MADKLNITTDTKAFMKSMKAAYGIHYPHMIASTFSQLATEGLAEARKMVALKYNLHTDFIPRNFQAIPINPAQVKAAERSLKAHGDMMAAVYLKGAVDPKYSLRFMADHEEGTTRKPKKKAIAAPGSAYSEKKAKTGTGKTRKRWKPAEMLSAFRKSNSAYEQGTTITRAFPGRRSPVTRGFSRKIGNWFIIKGRYGTPMIVRRNPAFGIRQGVRNGKTFKRSALEFGYALEDKQKIKATFEFVETVFKYVADNLKSAAFKADRKIPRKI